MPFPLGPNDDITNDELNELHGISGVDVTGTPAAGQVPTATSPTAAEWQDVGGPVDLLPIGQLTATTPFGHPGFYAPTSEDPVDGGFVDVRLTASLADQSLGVGATNTIGSISASDSGPLGYRSGSFQAYADDDDDVFAEATGYVLVKPDGSDVQATLGVFTNGSLDGAKFFADETATWAEVNANVGQTAPVFLAKNSAEDAVFTVGPTGYVDHRIQTAPAAPAANYVRYFARDVAGKVQFCVLFPTGAIQVLAAEEAPRVELAAFYFSR